MTRNDHRGGNGNSGADGGDHDRGHHRRPYISPYGSRELYGPGYGALGWISPYPLDYPETGSTDNSAALPDQTSAEGYDAQPDEQGLPPYPGAYPPASVLPNPSSAPESEEAVTIVFKDGRQPEQIHNYILTRSTLFVGDKQRREIPTDQLDLAATAKVNQDAGVDFRLPDSTR
jgi:hypothetical protein